jgi:hypothetical protein
MPPCADSHSILNARMEPTQDLPWTEEGAAFQIPTRWKKGGIAARLGKVLPPADLGFEGRNHLRKLSTQVLSDSLPGYIETIANAYRQFKAVPAMLCSPKAQQAVLEDLTNLFLEEVTHNFIELDITQIKGARFWPTEDRYPSLQAFCSIVEPESGLSEATSFAELPGLFERSINGFVKPSDIFNVPRVAKQSSDGSFWWSETIDPPCLAALLRGCRRLRVDFRFKARLVLAHANLATIRRLGEDWTLLLCSRRVRDAVEYVCEKDQVPCCWLPIPVFPRAAMPGFNAEVVSFRDENHSVNDFLICLLNSHPDTHSLRVELATRADTFDFSRYLSDLAAQTKDVPDPKSAIALEVLPDH